MKNAQRGFIVPVLLAIIAVLVIGGGVYFYESKKVEIPTTTNNTGSQSLTQQQVVNQNQQNSQPGNTTSSQSSAVCGNFTELSDFVLKNIQQPDSQKIMEMNPYVITSFHWKRNVAEPFVSYPIINGVSAFYGYDKTNHSIDFTVSAIKKDSDALNQAINTEAKNLGLSINSVNTLPLQSFSNQDVTQVFAFNKGESLYAIALTVDSGDHQASPQGTVKITCGKALDTYDKVYSALNLKADFSVKDSYNNDYVAIGGISSDNTVYAILGSPNQIKIADYYYFDGKTLRLVSKDSYPTQCAPLESQKVGLGMRCADANYNQRTITYLPTSNTTNTYTNSQYGFSLQYPSDLQPETKGLYGASAIVGFPLKSTFFTSDVSVQVLTDSSAVANCNITPVNEMIPNTDAGTSVINGISFHTYKHYEPATGQEFGSQTYTAVHNGKCFSLVYAWEGEHENHLSASDDEIYKSDMTTANAKLDPIIQSFKFTQ